MCSSCYEQKAPAFISAQILALPFPAAGQASPLQFNGRMEDVDRGVDVVEVYDQLAELVLGVIDLACDLGTLGNEGL